MSDLFSIGVTGMQAQSNALAIIGNNISNASTCGYKSNSMTFSEVLVTHQGQYLNGLQIQYGNGVQTLGVTSDWSSGSVTATGLASNIAISGDGFLPVSYNGEIYYTRAGDFSLVEYEVESGVNGYVLMRADGSILLGGTADASTGLVTTSAESYMYFDAAPTSYSISSDGTVTAIGANVVNGSLGVQRFNNPDSLTRVEGGLYLPTNLTSYTTGDGTAPAIPGSFGSGTLLQGNLEASNTDLVTEFTKLIKAQRAFQGCSKVITVADEILQTILSLKR